MKKLALTLSIAALLSGCATLSAKNTPADALQQGLSPEDQTQLNTALDTAKDDTPTAWHNEEGDTAFELTTSGTHVNGQGLPCRNYTLSVDRDYHRKQITTAVACRDNGQWKNSN